MRYLIWLLLFAVPAFAQTPQKCVCTSGCVVVADAFPPGGNQPTSCTLYKDGVLVGTSSTVPSNLVALDNSKTCLPPDSLYNPGPTGSKTCWMTITLPLGVYNLTATTTLGGTTSPPSAPLVMESVTSITPDPLPATNLRKK